MEILNYKNEKTMPNCQRNKMQSQKSEKNRKLSFLTESRIPTKANLRTANGRLSSLG